ncbi:Peptidoglycan/xylan/chitin deacetylase, PgdA/CDA1 family [Evansella caseinilytica]|uniref:Peptidoglycan/xylan/chitin deacetylase, PgdA/CDA1 family n=1 Tax=Evansella caseinilytica TaxID=1503961 RepID=A0A1H3U4U6_9BACI|nr:polysaccharide deacetylase family protein [Evansella caseinilytica]SDZ57358.1 Peptidoglycan/xylan/chitin deacetylase, PgdA/CDA1 family [Evansella caseinilytica]
MLKKIQFMMVCVLAAVLFFVISNKTISTNWTQNEQSSSQTVEENNSKGEQASTEEIIDKEDVEEPIADEDTGNIVYLTFDDGPNSASAEILDILDQFNAKATFFMLEPAMRTYPDIVNRIAEDGHAVALHGVTHDKNKFYQSEQSALDEMKTNQETLENITGVRSYLIRTPYGSIPYLTDSFREVLDNNGFTLWDWNIDSDDWSLAGGDYVQNVISQIEQLDDGETPVVLMHDKSETANHLSKLLSYLQEHGYQTKIIEEHTEPYYFKCHERCYRLGN